MGKKLKKRKRGCRFKKTILQRRCTNGASRYMKKCLLLLKSSGKFESKAHKDNTPLQ